MQFLHVLDRSVQTNKRETHCNSPDCTLYLKKNKYNDWWDAIHLRIGYHFDNMMHVIHVPDTILESFNLSGHSLNAPTENVQKFTHSHHLLSS